MGTRFRSRVPSSKHTLFMRGFSLQTDVKDIIKFFKDVGECTYDSFRHSKSGDKMNISIRFKSRDIAKKVITKWNFKEVLGSKISITWYRDYRAARRRAALEARSRNPKTQSMADRLRAKYRRRKNAAYMQCKTSQRRKGTSKSRSRSSSPRQSLHMQSKSNRSLSLSDFIAPQSSNKRRKLSHSSTRSHDRSSSPRRLSVDRSSSPRRLSVERHHSRGRSLENRILSPKSRGSRSKSPEFNSNKQQFTSPHAMRGSSAQLSTEYPSPMKSTAPNSLYEEKVTARNDQMTNVNEKETNCDAMNNEDNTVHSHNLNQGRSTLYSSMSNTVPYCRQSDVPYCASVYQADENHNQEKYVGSDITLKNDITDHHMARSSTPPTPTQDEISRYDGNIKQYTDGSWSGSYTQPVAITCQNETGHGDVDYRKGRQGLSLSRPAEETDPIMARGTGPTTDLGLTQRSIEKVKVKKEQLETAYRQDCETFATVVKMLISKESCLESLVQHSLKENLKDMGKKCINELQHFIHDMREEEKNAAKK